MEFKPHSGWRIAHSEASTGWGGQEHRVMAELSGFQRRGCAVWLLAPRDSRIFQRAEAADVSAVPLPRGKPAFPLHALRLAVWLRRHRIQILNTHSSADGWLVGVAGRLARVPLIVRSRHIDVTYPNQWMSRHAFVTLADHIVTTSSRITEHFQEMFELPDRRITTLPTGIDLQRFSSTGEKAQLVPRAAGAGVPVIGMISVLRSWKGHYVFLDAARSLRDSGFKAAYVIVGAGPIEDHIRNRIKERGLEQDVHLFGHTEDVPAALRALSVLAIPSLRHEGVPQIGLQALACRIPVVGSDVGGIPEIVRPGETGRIVPVENPEALARALRDAVEQKAETQRLATNGRRLVEENYSVDRMLDSLEAIYRRHLDPQPTG